MSINCSQSSPLPLPDYYLDYYLFVFPRARRLSNERPIIICINEIDMVSWEIARVKRARVARSSRINSAYK